MIGAMVVPRITPRLRSAACVLGLTKGASLKSSRELFCKGAQLVALSLSVAFRPSPCSAAPTPPPYETIAEFPAAPTEPFGRLVEGPDGNLYGTTYAGGAHDFGTVFRVTPTGAVTVLVDFALGVKGIRPTAGLALASDGNLYGTTSNGGRYGRGTVFRMSLEGEFAVIADFDPATTSAARPSGPVIQASDGNLYGTAGSLFRVSLDGAFSTLGSTGTSYGALAEGDDGNLYGVAYTRFFRANFSGTVTTLLTLPTGSTSRAGLTKGSDGNFYGTLNTGGANNLGTLFRFSPDGTLTTLVDFAGSNGQGPYADLCCASDGTLYGTTLNSSPTVGGTVFKLTPGGTFSTVLQFNGQNGIYPRAGLVEATDGNLYGLASGGYALGGRSADGTIYKLTPAGVVSVLASFPRVTPVATRLVEGPDNCLYGTTFGGGSAFKGTVFRVTKGGSLTTLVTFTGPNGAYPQAGLILASDGNFYGTTNGLTSSSGTVFKLSPDDTFSVVAVLTSAVGSGLSAPLIEASDGNFYGTTQSSVFRMTPDGGLTKLATIPQNYSGLVEASDGNLYGTTYYGGTSNKGIVYRCTKSGTLTTLVNFDGTNGAKSYAGLIQGLDGYLYGSTTGAGNDGYGTLFKMTLDGNITTLVDFNLTRPEGANSPRAPMLQASDGNFYGTTDNTGGKVYRLTPDGTFTVLGPPAALTIGIETGLMQDSEGNLYGVTRGRAGGSVYRIRLAPLAFTGNDAILTFPSVAGQHYKIEQSANLATNPWSTLVPDLLGTDKPISVPKPNAGSFPFFFFRVLPIP